MLRRDLKVVGNHLSRCNNSSPRNIRENHYAILAQSKISYVFTYKISITLLIIYVLDMGCPIFNCKITNLSLIIPYL